MSETTFNRKSSKIERDTDTESSEAQIAMKETARSFESLVLPKHSKYGSSDHLIGPIT